MRDIQSHLGVLLDALISKKYTINDIFGSYMVTSRSSFSGRALEQAISKSVGSLDVLRVGPVTQADSTAVSYFEALPDDQQRRVLLLSILSMCYFSQKARDQAQEVAATFDVYLSEQKEEPK